MFALRLCMDVYECMVRCNEAHLACATNPRHTFMFTRMHWRTFSAGVRMHTALAMQRDLLRRGCRRYGKKSVSHKCITRTCTCAPRIRRRRRRVTSVFMQAVKRFQYNIHIHIPKTLRSRKLKDIGVVMCARVRVRSCSTCGSSLAVR